MLRVGKHLNMLFSLLDQNKQVISEHKELTTNDKGQITVDHLKPGTYYLKRNKGS